VEITLTIRAFTHGYDLYAPGQHILWHDYASVPRRRHWDDHRREHGVQRSWHDRYTAGIAKVAGFLAQPAVERYGLGTARTFTDYEAYAGISFGHRRFQDYTLLNETPPNPPASPSWPGQVQDRHVAIEVDISQLPAAAVKDPTCWFVAVYDNDGRRLHRRDATPSELADLPADDHGHITLTREFPSEAAPASWTVRPHSASAGWLEQVTGAISDCAGTLGPDDRPA
jgi:hypothetical protein